MSSNAATPLSSSDALFELLAPDGYYTYLGIPKQRQQQSSSDGSGNKINDDTDLIKKNYRKLSLRHHPDKPGGDADTFRLLNRAQKVLLNEKLRQQYDTLGIDLDDDVQQPSQNEDETATTSSAGNAADDGGGERPTTAQGIVREIASNILTVVIQLGIRTLMLGGISVVITRFWWMTYPALLFLSYICFRMYQTILQTPGATIWDMKGPFMIGVGTFIMYASRAYGWNYIYWFGESWVIGMFLYNSIPIEFANHIHVMGGIGLISFLLSLWFRGLLWNYVITLGLIALLGIFVALLFPFMELILETILNEKLKLIGEKVRYHHNATKQYYENKIKIMQQQHQSKKR